MTYVVTVLLCSEQAQVWVSLSSPLSVTWPVAPLWLWRNTLFLLCLDPGNWWLLWTVSSSHKFTASPTLMSRRNEPLDTIDPFGLLYYWGIITVDDRRRHHLLLFHTRALMLLLSSLWCLKVQSKLETQENQTPCKTNLFNHHMFQLEDSCPLYCNIFSSLPLNIRLDLYNVPWKVPKHMIAAFTRLVLELV